jgi:hypothetical protein
VSLEERSIVFVLEASFDPNFGANAEGRHSSEEPVVIVVTENLAITAWCSVGAASGWIAAGLEGIDSEAFRVHFVRRRNESLSVNLRLRLGELVVEDAKQD